MFYQLLRFIDTQASYCEDNCLTFSLKKTQIAVFCKSGKLSIELFHFNGTDDMFSYCQSDLYKRALRAQFKPTKCFLSLS